MTLQVVKAMLMEMERFRLAVLIKEQFGFQIIKILQHVNIRKNMSCPVANIYTVFENHQKMYHSIVPATKVIFFLLPLFVGTINYIARTARNIAK